MALQKINTDLISANTIATGNIADNSVDLVTSCLAMHWINDLPGLFREVQRILKPDGVFIGGIDNAMQVRLIVQLSANRGNVWRGHPCGNASLFAAGRA